ncbi:MAG: rhodanese-like domain-containing protein [Saprospiraceae bacterium]|jgi:phage shock protein E|nr:rhodanese-like domain-containing protein [Saprospiraceae bacterium]
MKQVVLFFFMCLTVALSAQISDSQKFKLANMEPFYIDVDIKTAKLVEQVQGSNLVFLDIRTKEEIGVGKIQGAVELDAKSLDFDEKLASLDKTKQYMVYCYAGGLSKNVMYKMKELGFKQIYNLEPGYKAWKEASSKQ